MEEKLDLSRKKFNSTKRNNNRKQTTSQKAKSKNKRKLTKLIKKDRKNWERFSLKENEECEKTKILSWTKIKWWKMSAPLLSSMFLRQNSILTHQLKEHPFLTKVISRDKNGIFKRQAGTVARCLFLSTPTSKSLCQSDLALKLMFSSSCERFLKKCSWLQNASWFRWFISKGWWLHLKLKSVSQIGDR